MSTKASLWRKALRRLTLAAAFALAASSSAQAQQTAADAFLEVWDMFLKGCAPVVQDVDAGLAQLPLTFPGSGLVGTADRAMTEFSWFTDGFDTGFLVATARNETTVSVYCEISVVVPPQDIATATQTIRSMLLAGGTLKVTGGPLTTLNGTPKGDAASDVTSGHHALSVSGVFPGVAAIVAIYIYGEQVFIEVTAVLPRV